MPIITAHDAYINVYLNINCYHPLEIPDILCHEVQSYDLTPVLYFYILQIFCQSCQQFLTLSSAPSSQQVI